MPKPKKKAATKPRKSKGKVVVTQRAKIRPKGTRTVNADTIAPTPNPHTNGTVLKVKIKRK